MRTAKTKAAAVRKPQRNTKQAGFVRTKGEDPHSKTHRSAAKNTSPRPDSKLATIIKLLCRSEGATIDQMVEATGWQKHSVRGVMSGTLGKQRGLTITSTKADGKRVYRIAEQVEG